MWNGHNHILTGNEPFLGLVSSYFNKKRLPHNQLNRLIVQQPLLLCSYNDFDLCADLRIELDLGFEGTKLFDGIHLDLLLIDV